MLAGKAPQQRNRCLLAIHSPIASVLITSGQSASDIRKRFEDLDIVPRGTLQNQNENRLLSFALDKVSRYRQGMIDFMKDRGGHVINALSQDVGLTAGIGLELGWSPAISINFEAAQELRS
jgi:hypothetical protein